MNTTTADWQGLAVAGLSQLTTDAMPAMELLYLDGLAIHLLGPDAPEPPYTMEHAATIASLLLRAVADAPVVGAELESGDVDETTTTAREAVVDGAHRLACCGGLGAQRLVKRFLPAAVGELEQHKEGPEAQVRSLFYYGLLAIASGPENQTNAETSDGVLASFRSWDERIGEGFVPPWRIVAQDDSPN